MVELWYVIGVWDGELYCCVGLWCFVGSVSGCVKNVEILGYGWYCSVCLFVGCVDYQMVGFVLVRIGWSFC